MMMKFTTNGLNGVGRIPVVINVNKILYITKLELLEIDGETPEKSIVVFSNGEELEVYGSVREIYEDISITRTLRGLN